MIGGAFVLFSIGRGAPWDGAALGAPSDGAALGAPSDGAALGEALGGGGRKRKSFQ